MEFISINSSELATVTGFCEAIQRKQSKPGSRDEHNNDKGQRRFGNNFIGKIGEYAATKIVGGVIDMRVWNTGSRGADQFEADIMESEVNPIITPFKGYKLHVKTCNSKHIFKGQPGNTASWTADRHDPLVVSPKRDDIIIFMFADNSGICHAVGWVYAQEVQRYWKACVSEHMKHKVAMYFKDMKHLIYKF